MLAFLAFFATMIWVHDLSFCQSDEPTRLYLAVHSQGGRTRKEDSGEEENELWGQW